MELKVTGQRKLIDELHCLGLSLCELALLVSTATLLPVEQGPTVLVKLELGDDHL